MYWTTLTSRSVLIFCGQCSGWSLQTELVQLNCLNIPGLGLDLLVLFCFSDELGNIVVRVIGSVRLCWWKPFFIFDTVLCLEESQ